MSNSCRARRCAVWAIRGILQKWRSTCHLTTHRSLPATTFSSTEDGVHNKSLAAVTVSLLLLSSCQSSKTKRIAVVPKGTSHVFWIPAHAGAAAAGQKFGVEILWNGPPQETEYDRQMQIVDSYLTQHVDGLAVAATERKVLNRSLDRAAELGIP